MTNKKNFSFRLSIWMLRTSTSIKYFFWSKKMYSLAVMINEHIRSLLKFIQGWKSVSTTLNCVKSSRKRFNLFDYLEKKEIQFVGWSVLQLINWNVLQDSIKEMIGKKAKISSSSFHSSRRGTKRRTREQNLIYWHCRNEIITKTSRREEKRKEKKISPN